MRRATEPLEWTVRVAEGSRSRAYALSYVVLEVTWPDRHEPLKVELLESGQYELQSPNPICIENLHLGSQRGAFVLRLNVTGPIVLNVKVADQWTKALSITAQLENPYVFGEPIREEHLFFGRQEELGEIHRGVTKRNKQNFLITGPRRMGKTSLLYQLKARLQCPFLALMLTPEKTGHEHFQMFRSILLDLGEKAREDLAAEPPPIGYDVQTASAQTSIDLFNFYYERDFIKQLEWLAGISPEARVILLLDEASFLLEGSPRILAGHDTRQQFLRHLLQSHDRLACVLAGTPQLLQMTSVTSPLYNIFSGIKLRGLSPEEAARLIREPARSVDVSYDDDAVAKILDYGGLSPYYTQALCSLALDEMYKSVPGPAGSDASYVVTVPHVDMAIHRLLDTVGYGLQSIWDGLQVDEQGVLLELAKAGSVEVDAGNREVVSRLADQNLVVVNDDTRFASIKARLDEEWLCEKGA